MNVGVVGQNKGNIDKLSDINRATFSKEDR